MSSDKMEQKLKNAELFRDCINEKLKTNPPNSEWLQKLADIVTESSQIDSDDEDDSETESIKSHDDIDDHGVMCHYSRTTGGWEAIEPFCVECGYGDDNCECEEEKTNCECPFPKFIIKDGFQMCRSCGLLDHYKNGNVDEWSDDEEDYESANCETCCENFLLDKLEVKDEKFYCRLCFADEKEKYDESPCPCDDCGKIHPFSECEDDSEDDDEGWHCCKCKQDFKESEIEHIEEIDDAVCKNCCIKYGFN